MIDFSKVTQLWRRNPFLSGVLVFLFASFAFLARIPVQAQDQGPGTIRKDVNLVVLDATVKNKDGQIMDSLKKEDFAVREDGVAKTIELFSRDELPLNVALVLDLSDSIGPFLGPLRDAATTTLGALKPEDTVALFTFSTEAELREPLSKDKNKIAEEISSFQAGGATNINDGIFVAAEYLLKSEPKERRVIILISDDVSTDAGGEIFDVTNVANLNSVFGALIQRIKTRYTLGYYTSINGADGKPHKLDVRLAPSFGVKGRNYTLLAKTSFYFR